MIPLLDSLTVGQAALLAAIGEALLTLDYAIALMPVFSGHTPLSNLAPVILGAIVPSLVWSAFFFILYRERNGLAVTLSVRAATWITLFLGIGLQVVFVLIPAEMATLFLTPLGIIRRIDSWFLRLGWVCFLVLFARMPAEQWTRRMALLLAILSAPYALSTAYDTFNNGIGFLFEDMPRQALWRALVTPMVRTIYWLSQVMFLWTAWREPLQRDMLNARPPRLAP